MKQYPRMHSLGAINIIHHQEFDYKFHPFRTDFTGESRVGKSIKNGLYFFILENGLFEKLKTFEPNANYQTTDYKIKSLEKLANDLP